MWKRTNYLYILCTYHYFVRDFYLKSVRTLKKRKSVLRIKLMFCNNNIIMCHFMEGSKRRNETSAISATAQPGGRRVNFV